MAPSHAQASPSVAATAFVALISAFALGAVTSSLLSGGRDTTTSNTRSNDGTRENNIDDAACTTYDNTDPQANTKAAAEEKKSSQSSLVFSSIDLHPIGKISSVYRLCVGTPRQGMLAPNSRGRIELSPSLLSADSILGLDGFSHVWVIFVFHLNTNASVVKKSAEAAAVGSAGGSGGGGSRQFPSKIAPPALGGQKVGLFSTRTPHRPNPIGLTLCKIDSISRGSDPSQPFHVNVSGLDLVDGTPVLDIKPFVPHYDSVISPDDADTSIVMPDGVTLPTWVGCGLEKRRNVTFTDEAVAHLDDIVRTNPSALEFYGPHSGRDDTLGDGIHAVRGVISQVLAVDVRSRWQTGKARRGKFQAEKAGRVKEVMNGTIDDAEAGADTIAKKEDKQQQQQQQLCTQQLDNLLIKYSVSAPSSGKEDTMAMGSGASDDVTVQAIEFLRTGAARKSKISTRQKNCAASCTTAPEGCTTVSNAGKAINDGAIAKKGSNGGEDGEAGTLTEPPKEFGALKQYWSARGDTHTPSGLTPSKSAERLDKQEGSGRLLAFSNRRILPTAPQRDVMSKANTRLNTSEITNMELPLEEASVIVDVGGTDSVTATEEKVGTIESSNDNTTVKEGTGDKSESQPHAAARTSDPSRSTGNSQSKKKRQRKKKKKATAAPTNPSPNSNKS
mmetsp:Transcript_11576/g.24382  ORF Transcript_11576/g.24382 Transcript_11576/m.24382 type:complete len:672 (-) Transcript_11576:27-2042(-)